MAVTFGDIIKIYERLSGQKLMMKYKENNMFFK
jgi:hypothetical protein